jgi:hypothetical protein
VLVDVELLSNRVPDVVIRTGQVPKVAPHQRSKARRSAGPHQF